MNAASALDKLISDFRLAGRPRIWSLVITIFGDAVQPRGGRISAARLTAVLERLGIESGAVRTAMSRLVKEGWIERERVGRGSFYRLSAAGKIAFEPATDRIFRAKRIGDDGVFVSGVLIGGSGDVRVALDRDVARNQGWVLAAGCYLWTEDAAPERQWFLGNGVLRVTGGVDLVPETVFKLPAFVAQAQACEALLVAFSGFLASDLGAMRPLDAIALRVMLVHYWRRIVLRYPEVPSVIAPADWLGGLCRERVAEIYQAVLGPSDNWLQQAKGLEGLPDPDGAFFTRFGGVCR